MTNAVTPGQNIIVRRRVAAHAVSELSLPAKMASAEGAPPTAEASPVDATAAAAAAAPPPPPPPPAAPAPETPGAALRRLHARAHPALLEFSALVSDYIDGVWLPEGDDAVARRAVALGRRLVVRETEVAQAEAAGARAEARAAAAEAQLRALVGQAGDGVRLREELGEARAALLALQQSTGEAMGKLFEAHGATLAEENADLRVALAAKERELAELKDVLLELRRSGGQERVELPIFGGGGGGGGGGGLRKVNQGREGE